MAIGNVGTLVPMNAPSHLISSQAQSAVAVAPKAANMAAIKVELSPAAISLSQKEVAGDKVESQLTSKQAETEKSDGVKSFAYGVLGMDHPDQIDAKEDDSYTAGQFLKAAATVGSVIALFI
ncbi:hypothetical protein HWQ46_21275 [Shewanella sp. D64]|uniref:hypothetical protein n=1 Tax=unclassified Shewanella TaxID=196818 RepID=UPI0022BA41A0|nr:MULTISPECIES: hypothetical protein [unclassified Shewanella]MEC4728071.1 hypothetical protein [Shewanella sp. D64]MEC4738171.1 hypothetical protein [Shewanella sp. E94]WBJ96318.1 hypothetical protein HWQ47_04115 [Shewanella sp. MTB7]